MIAPKMTIIDYVNYLAAAPHVVSCTEAARVQPGAPRRAGMMPWNQLLQRLERDSAPMWQEAKLLREHCAMSLFEPGAAASQVRYHMLIAEALNARNGSQARLLMRLHLDDTFGRARAHGDASLAIWPYA